MEGDGDEMFPSTAGARDHRVQDRENKLSTRSLIVKGGNCVFVLINDTNWSYINFVFTLNHPLPENLLSKNLFDVMEQFGPFIYFCTSSATEPFLFLLCFVTGCFLLPG